MLFQSGVEEIFEVKVLPGYRNPILSGPLPEADGTETVWMVPEIDVIDRNKKSV